MIDITRKKITLRSAVARGTVRCSAETRKRIADGTLPKGNLFDVARAAGLLGAKQTAALIPHCHPVSIDGMEIDLSLNDNGVEITVTGQSIGRTGIEMEALTACSVACLTVYDLLKPIDKDLEIVSVKLLDKKGGKTQYAKDVKEGYRAAVLVCSDSTSAGEREDRSGAAIQEILEGFGVPVDDLKVVPDDVDAIQRTILEWVERDIPFVFTTGGTGFGPRDVTVEAVRTIISKEASGIGEAMRIHGLMRTPRAMLSRAIAGSVNHTLIVTLPGSERGVRESLDAILPSAFHAREMLLGG